MRFEFIDAERARHSVKRLCSVLNVSRAGYYAWKRRGPSMRRRRDDALRVRVRAVFDGSRCRYGSPRVYRELRLGWGEIVGRHRIARLMRQAGLVARPRRRFRVTTVVDPGKPIAPNVVARRFSVDAPNRVWAGDITYFPTANGWLYLAVLLDLYSRAVVGWAMSDTNDQRLASNALDSAVARRNPGPGLVCHSDRGSQYTSDAYQARLRAIGATCSMSRKGDCWDNAVSESFFGTLKVELALPPTVTRSLARAEVFEYIETFYNPIRRHSTLGYLSPATFEAGLC